LLRSRRRRFTWATAATGTKGTKPRTA
jgi:hypothetical protein